MTAQRKKIDPTRTDFGAVLGRCLRAMDIKYSHFAVSIQVHKPLIHRITNNVNNKISQQWIDDKKILEILKNKNTEIFQEFESDFIAAYAKLPAYQHAPQKYNTKFGETLTIILTESKLTLPSLCKQSKIEYTTFTNRVRENNLSQDYLSAIKLREHLENITGEVFTKYAHDFDEIFRTLPLRDKATKRRTDYKNQTELGGLIDRFLKDSEINIANFAYNMNISRQRLHQVITGQYAEASVKWIKKHRLYEVLNELSPELFQTMKSEFENWERNYVAKHGSEKAAKPRKEKPVKEACLRGRPPLKEKPLKISVDFYNAVRDYVRVQMTTHNDTPESIKEKFSNASRRFRTLDAFILSGNCIPAITETGRIRDIRLTDMRILKTFRVIASLYNETENYKNIIDQFETMAILSAKQARGHNKI